MGSLAPAHIHYLDAREMTSSILILLQSDSLKLAVASRGDGIYKWRR